MLTMLGRHHLTLSVATVALIVLPLFPLNPLAVLLILVGSAIGSLVPDADSPDAAVFHSEVRGLGDGLSDLLNAPAALYPVFGFVTKYLIYKPAVIFYDQVVFDENEIRERHRGFLHSFIGLGTITVLTTVYLLPVLYILDLFWIVGITVFMLGYLGGAILHLVQDSCTKSGIQWNFPFQKWKLRGQITTSAKREDMRYQRGFLTLLGAGVATMFFVPNMFQQIATMFYVILGLVVAVLSWTVFAVVVADCNVSKS